MLPQIRHTLDSEKLGTSSLPGIFAPPDSRQYWRLEVVWMREPNSPH